jgi:release factor glutamine methyltransferase
MRTWTALDLLRWTAGRFEERGMTTPRLDAELLIAHVLGISRVSLYMQFDRPLDGTELGALRDLVRRRQAGEPVAYLVGHKEFWGIDLLVDRRVLVPRPDTETLVEEALDRLDARLADAPPPRVADVGTGSGALALALAHARPFAAICASDVSPDALAIARTGAERLGLPVTFVEGDLAGPLLPHAPFDLVVANLPYIPTGDLADLPPEVLCEPRLALDGGADGLDLVRRLVAEAGALLGPGGALAVEIGAGQAAAVAALFEAAGFGAIRTRRDLGGIDRVVSGVRP